jgi:glyceraldehyde 3-phosphate dehydrogenase
MKARVGINGLGRSGRQALKAILQRYPDTLEVVAANDLGDPETMAWLFAHDSNYGAFPGTVKIKNKTMIIDDQEITILTERDPAKLKWGELGVELVIESTGVFTKRDKAALHLEGGAKRVVIGAPSPDPDITLVLGVNETAYAPEKHHVLSMASCTTNCVAPMAKVLLDKFGIVKGLLTTVHAYTADQNLLDAPHKDLRRARAAAMSMVPTSTGAAKATALVIPELKGKLHGIAVRVPTTTVSLTDLVVELDREVTLEDVMAAFKEAEAGALKGILGVSEEPLVSIDFKGDTRSSIIDALSSMMMGTKMLKVLSWYDNEWGYSTRLSDLCYYITHGQSLVDRLYK